MTEPAKTCPKCGGPLTVCICCGEPALCRACKACHGYKPPPRIVPELARENLHSRRKPELKTA
jgi:hypothetical protein